MTAFLDEKSNSEIYPHVGISKLGTSIEEVINSKPETKKVGEEEPIIGENKSIEIIDKGIVANKNQTKTMRQLFRANIKDEDCRFFLESKGAKMPIGMTDKLVFSCLMSSRPTENLYNLLSLLSRT